MIFVCPCRENNDRKQESLRIGDDTTFATLDFFHTVVRSVPMCICSCFDRLGIKDACTRFRRTTGLFAEAADQHLANMLKGAIRAQEAKPIIYSLPWWIFFRQ